MLQEKSKDEDFDEENEIEDDVQAPAGSKVLTVNVTSLRFDTICKVGFGITRKYDTFYFIKIYLKIKLIFVRLQHYSYVYTSDTVLQLIPLC